MNDLKLIGRITHDLELKTLDDGKKLSHVCIAVPRPYKDQEGKYETDFINLTVWNSIAENMCNYCKKGDIVGISGRIEPNKANELQISAQRVSFISSKDRVQKEIEKTDNYER